MEQECSDAEAGYPRSLALGCEGREGGGDGRDGRMEGGPEQVPPSPEGRASQGWQGGRSLEVGPMEKGSELRACLRASEGDAGGSQAVGG